MSVDDLPEFFVGHRVLDAAPPALGPDTTGAVGAQGLAAFLAARQERPALSLADLARGRGTGQGPRPFLLTFDDAFADFETRALPVLERFGVPALLFVAIDWAEGRRLPFEYRLASLLAQAPGDLEIDGQRLPLGDAAARGTAYAALRRRVARASADARDAFLARLSAAAGIATEHLACPPLLGVEALAHLAAHPLVTLGAHSLGHPLLPARPPTEAWREIRGSRARLAGIAGTPVEAFAYPYGASSRAVRAMVALAGFSWGFVTDAPRPGRLSGTARYRVPRTDLASAAGGA